MLPLFVIQAGLLFWIGTWRGDLRFAFARNVRAVAGLALIAYATILYPLLGALAGHHYPATPTFGVTPCPVTVFTIGMLLLATPRPPWRLLVIPAAWSLIGGSAAVLLHVPQDWMLLASGPLVLVLLALKKRHPRPAPRPT
jgi:hypothetical protein